MYIWYERSSKCYAYLEDNKLGQFWFDYEFRRSRWFQRGWTLQELIAPGHLQFFDRNWSGLGSRKSLASEIYEITRIPTSLLTAELDAYERRDLGSYSIAERMSWAAFRKTTRIEDIAYSLMGIFDVNMPLLYGEGDKAFIRLQEEIIKKSADDSIFAWGHGLELSFDQWHYIRSLHPTPQHFLAYAPSVFQNCSKIRKIGTLQSSKGLSTTR